MTFSQRITGKNSKVFWIDSSGTADLSGDRRTLEISDSFDTVDASAGTDTARGMLPTLRVLGATLTALNIGTAGTAVYNRIAAGSAGTLMWGEIGTASGAPKGAFPAVVKSFTKSLPYDGMSEINVTFEPQGDYSSNPNSATW